MDKARLRENARIVRTLSGELRAAIEPRNERFEKEAYEKIRAAREKGEQVDWGNEDEQTKIDAAIKGAEIIKTEWTNDDGCLVTLRLDKKRLQDMMGVKFK